MSQQAFLQRIDEKLSRAISRMGAQDDAFYYSADGTRNIACKVCIDRNVQLIGFDSQVINDQVTITALLGEIEERPLRGAQFIIGCESFSVDSILNADESRVVCVVKKGD